MTTIQSTLFGLLLAAGACGSCPAPSTHARPQQAASTVAPPASEPSSPVSRPAPATPPADEPGEPSAPVSRPASPPVPEPPACTAAALMPSIRGSRFINHARRYRLLSPRCIGDFAAATVQSIDDPDDQIATILWGLRNNRWQVITVSTWVECPELAGEIPPETCKQLMAMGGPIPR